MANEPITVDAMRMVQPIGEFFICVMNFHQLRQISFYDRRTMENELDNYMGIQRKLNKDRIEKITQFVGTIDATFPTSVVLAVPEKCTSYNEGEKQISFFENLDTSDGEPGVKFFEIAKVLDGQHRIEGLSELEEEDIFEIPVTIIVNADMADQAHIFATVNLAQTKVNRSLVYDLLDYSKARSPQKTCHEVVVALNRHPEGPFHKKIKRLGSTTPGVSSETLTQATFVTSLLLLLSKDPVEDRDLLLRGKKLPDLTDDDKMATPFRELFMAKRDSEIAKNISEYFKTVSNRWPDDWQSTKKGNILPRTNGFHAFMRLFKLIYLELVEESGSTIFDETDYAKYINKVEIEAGNFTTDAFPPGSSGAKQLFDVMLEQTELAD